MYPAKQRIVTFFLALALLLALWGCAITAPYDQYVYAQTTGLKVDALKLMDKAVKPYSEAPPALEKFTDNWDKLFEYELHRKNNGIRIEMWSLLRDPGKNLMGGFLQRWKKDNTLNTVFIDEAKIQVGKAFDQLSELESGKVKPKELK